MPKKQNKTKITRDLAKLPLFKSVAAETYLVEEPRAEHDLDGVVDDQYLSQLERLTIFHQPRAQDLALLTVEKGRQKNDFH